MTERPQWPGQPLDQLDALTLQLAELLEAGVVQLESIKQNRSRSQPLDAYTLGRVIASFTVQRDDLWRFEEQFRQWSSGPLTATQQAEVANLKVQLLRLHEVVDDILSMAESLQRKTL